MKTLRVERSQLPAGVVALPVRTPLIRRGDDLAALARECVSGIARPGDVLAISETALAIAQGQMVRAECVRPSRTAYALSRRAGAMATVSQPESVQLVIEGAGIWKVLYACVMNVVGRAIGRRGMFYEILGESVAAIDGYTGTLPPFEQTIVLAPENPDAFAQSVRDGMNIACAIVDANDLQKAKVLGASSDVERGAVERALLANPHGNGDEQTPIVVLKWRGEGENPLLVRGAA